MGSLEIENPSSSCKNAGEKRVRELDLDDAAEDGPKMVKMRDLASVLLSEDGLLVHHSESAEVKQSAKQFELDEVANSQNAEETASVLSHAPESALTRCSSLSRPHVTTCLTLGSASISQSSANMLDDVSLTAKPAFPSKTENTHKANVSSSIVGLDLNTADASSMMDYDPFYPYKKISSFRAPDPSECGSTTGPLEEDGPLRVWKEMKQNGFLSSSHGGIPIPKRRFRQPKKRRENELKKKMELLKREPVNRFAKVAAPSGLLSGLNPGIINHVRNSKQVYSIIEAMVRSEKLDGQHGARDGDKETNDRKEDQKSSSDSFTDKFGSSMYNSSLFVKADDRSSELSMAEEKLSSEDHNASCFTSEHEDDTLSLKLSSISAMASENANDVLNNDLTSNQGKISSLSLKGANVAFQWLELLFQDIKGRLAALRRSRKRIRNVIQTELPHMLSMEQIYSQNRPYTGKSTDAEYSPEASEVHMVRWKAIFSQMDKQLSDEGKHLESWLEQVKEMQMQCHLGLKYVNPSLGPLDSSRFQSSEVLDREYAVMAAAASIYSTSNFAMSAGNVSCF